MEKLRMGRLFCLSLLTAAAALLPLFTSPAHAADGQSLREKRAEVSGMKRISALREGNTEAEPELALPVHQSFSLVPTDHWAYPALKHLSDRDLVEGYPSGYFQGDRPMSRYEFAQVMSNLLELSPADDKSRLAVVALQTEFSGELSDIAARIDEISMQLAEMQARLGTLSAANEAATP
ncbi:S-layer homology domain-containing protein [bacterium]|nr:S-layer homology domain-containing protein [bacterium]